jgi:CubicO group peptidase (beta-lactamase class C family)
MQLAEEGKVDIGAPIAQYIPDLADMTVGAECVEAKSAMTRPEHHAAWQGWAKSLLGSHPFHSSAT